MPAGGGISVELLQCDNIGLVRKGQPVLRQVSFGVAQGDLVGIAGPSGSGKTSLLRMMNGLCSPTEGTVFYKGKDIRSYDPPRLRREIGYVLQKPYLFAGTVRDNLEYPYHVWKQKPDLEEITAYLTRVNLTSAMLEKRGTEMSGGEQQRVALVRSLLAKPDVLLLDEITASLDADNTLIIERLVREEREERHLTVCFISHEREQLRRLAQRVVYLEQGRMTFAGSGEAFFQMRGEP
jgi:putative ABC transport system ATP-binding protein